MLTELYEGGRIDLLRAIRDRRLTIQRVYDAYRNNRLPYLAADIELTGSLWSAVEAWLPGSAPKKRSRKRYEVSWNALRRNCDLRDDASVSDLERVDWKNLQSTWPSGPADWNRMRAAVSAFLTNLLGDKHHPFRRSVINAIPKASEPPGRVPDLTPAQFWRIVDLLPEELRASFVLIAATGFRVREYLALTPEHLRPHTLTIEVPGTKTDGSADVVHVGEEVWPWIVAAVPSPLQYKALYRHWKRACAGAGSPELTIHDLRHFYGQQLVNAGRPEASVQQSMRHASPNMTRRYTKMNDKAENARTMDTILFPQPVEDPARTA
jgi:integrase